MTDNNNGEIEEFKISGSEIDFESIVKSSIEDIRKLKNYDALLAFAIKVMHGDIYVPRGEEAGDVLGEEAKQVLKEIGEIK